jgi:hypothetical protein
MRVYTGRRVQLPDGAESAERFAPGTLPAAERPDTAADAEVVVSNTPASFTPYHLPLQSSLRLHNHSPSGFSWGYHGSGPAQLALALLLDYTGDSRRALRLYQEFKRRVVAAWPGDGDWTLTGDQIDAAIAEIESKKEAA